MTASTPAEGTRPDEPEVSKLAQAMIDMARRQKAERAERMPDDETALRVLTDAYQRLREMGWLEAAYVPKSKFLNVEMLELDCSTVLTGYHDEHGFWSIAPSHLTEADSWPTRAILYRVLPSKGTPDAS